MGVLRTEHTGHASGGISVKCSKCQMTFTVSSISATSPARCEKCGYPMILRSDLIAIADACAAAKNNQIDSALSILQFLIEDLPEVGTAIGNLSSRYTLPLSERARWNMLMKAYKSGNSNAQEWLNLMCKASPDIFEQRTCSNCSSPVFIDKQHQGKTFCLYCQCAD